MSPIVKVGFALLVGLSLGCGGDDGPVSITGTATLPDCTDPPEMDLTGTWYDNGTLTILTDGCSDAPKDEAFQVCALQWVMRQDGNDVSIVVDNEYKVEGRICADTLHLKGGWWLPLADENGACNYADDDGTEVGIQSEGASLTAQSDPMTMIDSLNGTLVVQERCTAQYEVQFNRL